MTISPLPQFQLNLLLHWHVPPRLPVSLIITLLICIAEFTLCNDWIISYLLFLFHYQLVILPLVSTLLMTTYKTLNIHTGFTLYMRLYRTCMIWFRIETVNLVTDVINFEYSCGVIWLLLGFSFYYYRSGW